MGRKIVIAAMNETVRKSSKEKDLDLATVGLTECVAVILKDKYGNSSLTHVDCATDLSFIANEAKRMQGIYTLDIVRHKEKGQTISTNIIEYLKSTLPGTKNSKGIENIKFESVRKTKNGCVLLRGDKILIPNFEHLYARGVGQNIDGNTFEENIVEMGSDRKDFQIRLFDRMFSIQLSLNADIKPIVAYDGRWLESFPEFPPKVIHIINSIKPCKYESAEMTKAIISLFHSVHNMPLSTVSESFQAHYIHSMPIVLFKKWAYEDKMAKLESYIGA